MFKNLLEFWKGKDFLSEVLEDFKMMLEDAKDMFQSSYNKLVHSGDATVIEQEVYDLDQRINAMQKAIRKRIIEHLSVNPSVDVMACLLLMSVVKDAERLGDFAKNLYEASILLVNPLSQETYNGLFGDIEQEILELFDLSIQAFIESDEEKARATWHHQRKIKRRCDAAIYNVSRSNLSVNEAVILALTARYLRRIASHLTNISTSVIVPLTDLDYFYDKNHEEGTGD